MTKNKRTIIKLKSYFKTQQKLQCYWVTGYSALPGKMLFVRIIENNKLMFIVGQVCSQG